MVLIVLCAFALGLVVGALGMVPHWWRHRSAARRAHAPQATVTPTTDTPATHSTPPHGI